MRRKILILFIVAVCLFLRLYKISGYMTFLGDEGRDALVWLRMIRYGKFTLIGPQTSIGNMYLGPLYYYLMLPFFLVLGTVGPSVGVALLAGATCYLLWCFGREWFSEMVGVLAALFYAISPVAIVLSRSSWNPNVMPFFALLTGWGIWQFWQKNNFFWLPVIGVTLSFAIQSHYLGLPLIPVVGIFFLIKLVELKRNKDKSLNKFILNFVLCVLCFVILTLLPLVWFDLRHNFINYQSFYKFFSERQTTVNFKIYKAVPNLWPLWEMAVARLLAGKNEVAGFWLAAIFGVCILSYLLHPEKIVLRKKAVILIVVWTIVGLTGMGLYKQHIYDHYFGFLYPAVFLLGGWAVAKLVDFHNPWKYFSLFLTGFIIVLSLVENPLKYPPNYQMLKVRQIDKKIINEAEGKSFNLALIAKQNYEAGYEYFLELWGKPPVQIDPQRFKETVTNQLFVVCEDSVCEPINHPKAQIASFGWARIENQWDFPWGTKLFKLIHF